MYQVLLVEDELLVRMGLKNSIPWNEFSMELSAMADNGVTAFELFQKLRPDVVVTDIRMEGMDGCQLIEKIRELDQECAIVVISCLDDFETLRRMMPFQIIDYILKSSMNMEEIYRVLRETRDYLTKIGRIADRSFQKGKSLNQRLADHLRSGAPSPAWKEEREIKEMLVFELSKEDQSKINELAMSFIYELVQRQIPGGILVELENKSFCLFVPEAEGDALEGETKQLARSINGFLGVQFCISLSRRIDKETLSEWYHRQKHEIIEEKSEEKQWDELIRKAVVYMRKHHGEVLQLTDISGVVGVSNSYFSYLFKKETGSNYVEFLNHIRLEEVLKDLCADNQKISCIAKKHGFNNQQYFWRYFKKNMGVSPAKWRQQNRWK